jgi:hypothetical protein
MGSPKRLQSGRRPTAVHHEERVDGAVERLPQAQPEDTSSGIEAGAATLEGSAENSAVGSDFDDFLAADGLLEEVSAIAIKRVVAWQLGEAMKRVGWWV